MEKKIINFVGNYEVFDESDLYNKRNIDQCIDWIKDLVFVCLDTETEGFFDHVNKTVMLQLSDGIEVWVLDTRNTNYIKRLKPYLESKLILGQNLKFDYKFLKAEGVILSNIYDTFLAECVLTNGLEERQLGLGALTKKYCGKELDKSVRNQFIGLKGQPFTHKQIVYGSEDVLFLPEIKRKQLEEIERMDLTAWLDLENQACLALADIEYNGLGFNHEAWLKLSDKIELNLPKYEAELNELVKQESKLESFVFKYVQNDLFGGKGKEVNIKWTSPTQCLKLFRQLGCEIESADKKELLKYQNQYTLVKKYIDYKIEGKLASTYGRNFLNFINKTTKRIHGDFWQILNTARVSCGGSKSGKSSVNLQNLPAKNEYLNCFVARPGFKIIGIDYAAQEGRIAASGSNDDLWMATFIEGKDLHTEVCKLMFGIDESLVKTKPDFLRGKTYRDAAKTLNFGILFGMSGYKLSNDLQVTLEEADSLIAQYFKATKQLKSYLDACGRYGLKHGYIRSFKPYSMIRYFPKWSPTYIDRKVQGEIIRASYNTPVQGTAALMTKLALVMIRQYIIDNKLEDKVYLIHVVHDATYCEVREDFAEEFSKIQSDIMIEAGKIFQIKLPMLTDITIADYWTK